MNWNSERRNYGTAWPCPLIVTYKASAPEQIVAREPLWRDDDPADDAELVALCSRIRGTGTTTLTEGTLIIRDDHDVAHYLPATGGSVVLVLARCRDVEFKAPKKRHSVVLRCRYDRRRADVDVEDEDSESDEEAGSAESRAASLAAKLRARATAGGESGGTWGPNGEPDGRAVDPRAWGSRGTSARWTSSKYRYHAKFNKSFLMLLEQRDDGFMSLAFRNVQRRIVPPSSPRYPPRAPATAARRRRGRSGRRHTMASHHL